MRVRIARSTKMPTLYSYYLSGFGQRALDALKEARPFSAYHASAKEYETIEEAYEKIRISYEAVGCVEDERTVMPSYERNHKEKFGYQEDAVEFARKSKNVFINFAQGMGKSLTTMKIIDDRGLKRVLIVCGQGNLQEEWVKDAIKHEMKDKLNIRIIGDDTGAGNAAKVKWLTREVAESGVDLVNIEALRNESVVDALNARRYDCIVVDEVQSAKGWKAEQTEGLHELERYEGQMRIALSGTPVLNSPLEFFSVLKYFGMLCDTARTTFERYYGEWGFDFWGHYVCKGFRNLPQLYELMKPVICTASKEELNLPIKKRKKIDLDWQEPERFVYLKRMYKASTKALKKAGFTSKPQIKAEMQFLNSTADVKIDFIEKHSLNNRILVFSQYTTVLEKYQQHLSSKGIKVLYYHGQLSMNERLNILNEWREGDYNVLLLSIMTARYGLNLTEAKEVVFIEPPTSLAILEQAEDRAHRIGQDEPVTSYLLSVGDMDDDALTNIAEKQRAIDELNDLAREEK